MYYSKIFKADVVNGEGVRLTLVTSGCTLNCPGCFQPQTHAFNYGQLYTQETEQGILTELEKPYYSGLSILGGNPTELQNIDAVYALCYNVKTKFPNKSIWLWSGHYLREIQKCSVKRKILDVVDTVVDGRFVQELYDPSLLWKGSKNQSVLYKGIDF